MTSMGDISPAIMTILVSVSRSCRNKRLRTLYSPSSEPSPLPWLHVLHFLPSQLVKIRLENPNFCQLPFFTVFNTFLVNFLDAMGWAISLAAFNRSSYDGPSPSAIVPSTETSTSMATTSVTFFLDFFSDFPMLILESGVLMRWFSGGQQ